MRLGGHIKGNWMSMFIHSFCLCPPSLTIMLNFKNYYNIKSGVLSPEIHRRVFRETATSNLPLPWCHMDVRIGQHRWLTNCTWILISNHVMQTKKSLSLKTWNNNWKHSPTMWLCSFQILVQGWHRTIPEHSWSFLHGTEFKVLITFKHFISTYQPKVKVKHRCSKKSTLYSYMLILSRRQLTFKTADLST